MTVRSSHYYLDPALLFTSIPLAIGGALWITTYILIIRQSFRDKAYGLPMFAICLNITWEALVLRSCVPDGDPMGLCPKPAGGAWMSIAEKGGIFVDISWFALDCILLYQLFRFGRALEPTKQIRTHWAKVLLASLVLAYMLQYGFALFYEDTFLIRDAWIINMIMSLSFLWLLFDREERDLRGLSIPAAWTKLGGNLMYATGLTIVHLKSGGTSFLGDASGYFMYTLFASTMVFDVLYIVYLTDAYRDSLRELSPA